MSRILSPHDRRMVLDMHAKGVAGTVIASRTGLDLVDVVDLLRRENGKDEEGVLVLDAVTRARAVRAYGVGLSADQVARALDLPVGPTRAMLKDAVAGGGEVAQRRKDSADAEEAFRLLSGGANAATAARSVGRSVGELRVIMTSARLPMHPSLPASLEARRGQVCALLAESRPFDEIAEATGLGRADVARIAQAEYPDRNDWHGQAPAGRPLAEATDADAAEVARAVAAGESVGAIADRLDLEPSAVRALARHGRSAPSTVSPSRDRVLALSRLGMTSREVAADVDMPVGDVEAIIISAQA